MKNMNGKRIFAFMIDFIIAGTIQAVLMFALIILPIVSGSGDAAHLVGNVFLITMISMVYLVLRDSLGKESIGKKILKLKIIDRNGDAASFGKRILRNLTFLMGPVEIVIFLIRDGKRLGDAIAKTNVVSK
jgi:uncharacterized RDD family membrane protein YckC